jgi:parallel beta-helix repeat protein
MTRPASQRFGAARIALILATVCVTPVWLASPASAQGGTIHVRAGQPIQAAINAAHPGDQILVEAGTYAEQLTIEKDGITLVGLGAILVPPATPGHNKCSGLAGNGTQAGICVMGSDVNLAPYESEHRKVLSVGRPVEDVLITGFQVRNFSGENIAVVGAKDAWVTGNKVVDGEQYGILTAGSNNTRVAGNTVVSSKKVRFIGTCMDDVAGVQVLNNHISGYGIAFCVQTPGADVRYNDISDSCIGVFVDPGIDGAKIRQNHISATNPRCTKDFPYGAYGIILDGAVNSEVRYNLIEGQTDDGLPNQVAAGLAIVDDQTTHPVAVASGNVVTQNILFNNDLGLLVNTTGTGNVITHNNCSTPKELCT